MAGDVANMARHSHLTNQALIMASLNSYDNIGRTTFVQHFTGSTFASYQSAFDAAGRMTSSSRSTAGGVPSAEYVTYAHDNTGQLTSVNRNGVVVNYGYDATAGLPGAPHVAYPR